MEMKSLEVLTPLWLLNTPPTFKNENCYLQRLECQTHSGEQLVFHALFQWCPYDKQYFVEPVNLKHCGTLSKTEVPLDAHAYLAFEYQMSLLGILDLRSFVDCSKQQDYAEQWQEICGERMPAIK
jgi:hypothetical protein